MHEARPIVLSEIFEDAEGSVPIIILSHMCTLPSSFRACCLFVSQIREKMMRRNDEAVHTCTSVCPLGLCVWALCLNCKLSCLCAPPPPCIILSVCMCDSGMQLRWSRQCVYYSGFTEPESVLNQDPASKDAISISSSNLFYFTMQIYILRCMLFSAFSLSMFSLKHNLNWAFDAFP